MECRVAAFSRAGGRARNEDACGYLEANGIVCCVLADGAGGHGGGDVASRLSVQTVLNDFVARPEVSVAALNSLLQNANQAVLAQQQKDPSLAEMCSTLVVLMLDPVAHTAIWGHVGDSRLYLLRNGACCLHTRDHSLVQTMVDSGMISAEEAMTHKDRNILIASIGMPEQFMSTTIDAPFTLRDGDAFLLCSDGLWGLITESEIESQLMVSASPDDWLNRMEQLVSIQVTDGSDNYSAVGVWCGKVDEIMRTLPLANS